MIISRIAVEITPTYYSGCAAEITVRVECQDGRKFGAKEVLKQNDMESRFDFYMKRLTNMLKDEIEKSGGNS